MKYVLIYHIDDYLEMGGGLQVEWFETLNELDKAVEKIFNCHTIHGAGEFNPFEYEAVEYATKIERKI
jgi:hypothetical protein